MHLESIYFVPGDFSVVPPVRANASNLIPLHQKPPNAAFDVLYFCPDAKSTQKINSSVGECCAPFGLQFRLVPELLSLLSPAPKSQLRLRLTFADGRLGVLAF
ncbi:MULTISPECIES: hypothetical protein [Chitinophagaceae]